MSGAIKQGDCVRLNICRRERKSWWTLTMIEFWEVESSVSHPTRAEIKETLMLTFYFYWCRCKLHIKIKRNEHLSQCFAWNMLKSLLFLSCNLLPKFDVWIQRSGGSWSLWRWVDLMISSRMNKIREVPKRNDLWDLTWHTVKGDFCLGGF